MLKFIVSACSDFHSAISCNAISAHRCVQAVLAWLHALGVVGVRESVPSLSRYGQTQYDFALCLNKKTK